MDRLTIIATSLNSTSKSQLLAAHLGAVATDRGHDVEIIDLRSLDLPLAGTPGCWDHPAVSRLSEVIADADHIVIATPIYCYDANAAAKNVIELANRAFEDKVVGFVCSAGGMRSYMSVMALANHLMLDFRSVIVPRFVYVNKHEWTEDGAPSADVDRRLKRLCEDLERVSVGPAPAD